LLDTNSQWLSLRLEELGFPVLYHASVGDDMAAMVQTVKQAVRRSDLIISTGGLGPTADDLTRQALAEAAGRPLTLDEASLAYIRRLFARRNRPMPEQNTIQAYFPEGSHVIANPDGTAPGIDLEFPREDRTSARWFALPGVPAEMRQMWSQTLEASLRQLGGGRQIIRHRVIKCFGAGESQIETMLPDLIRRGRDPRVGITASQTSILLRITASGATEEACRMAMQPTVATIHEHLGNLVFGEGADELQDVVLELLAERRQSLATIEWGTSGLVADWLGAVESQSSRHFAGGLVVSNAVAAERALHVATGLLAQSAQDPRSMVMAMASACRARFAADWAIAVGPFPKIDGPSHESIQETPQTPPTPEKSGSQASSSRLPPSQPLWFAAAHGDQVVPISIPFGGHPATLRALAAKTALNMIRLALLRP
jgi:nicotinamide-nucleotide amidase